MVKITNGYLTLNVTLGAFRDIYSAQGYKILNTSIQTSGATVATPQSSGGKFTEVDTKNATEVVFEDKTDYIPADTDAEPVDLSEIPLTEMSNDQLKAYAKQLGIDLKGITSRKAVRDKIRAAL